MYHQWTAIELYGTEEYDISALASRINSLLVFWPFNERYVLLCVGVMAKTLQISHCKMSLEKGIIFVNTHHFLVI